MIALFRRRYGETNYAYLLVHRESGDAVLVDPGDAAAARALCAEAGGARPRFIVHTHGHPDHVGGSAALREELGARVVGHPDDGGFCAPDLEVRGGETLALGHVDVELLAAPGHTAGSLLVRAGEDLFTGDTLFRGGCGNCHFGGDVEALARTFAKVIAPLPGGLRLQPGHDYAERNLRFAADLDPGEAVARSLQEAVSARVAGTEPAVLTLGDERRVNPFLRLAALRPALAKRGIGTDAGEAEAFLALRRLRDAWVEPKSA